MALIFNDPEYQRKLAAVSYSWKADAAAASLAHAPDARRAAEERRLVRVARALNDELDICSSAFDDNDPCDKHNRYLLSLAAAALEASEEQ